MTRETGTVPEWQLERYRLGELPPGEAAVLRSALATDEGLRERLAMLDRSDEEILAARPSHLFAARISALVSATERPQPRKVVVPWMVLGGAFALLIALGLGRAFVLTPDARVPRAPVTESDDATRVKGLVPKLLVFRQTPAGAEPLVDGSLVRTDEVVQLRYQSAGRAFGVIVSVDGRGNVTVHLPADAALAAPLAPGKPVALSDAYRLDDAPAFERFYLVTGSRPFPVALATEAVHRQVAAAQALPGTQLALPSGLQQSIFTLRKDVTR